MFPQGVMSDGPMSRPSIGSVCLTPTERFFRSFLQVCYGPKESFHEHGLLLVDHQKKTLFYFFQKVRVPSKYLV